MSSSSTAAAPPASTNAAPAATQASKTTKPPVFDFDKAFKRAIGGGISGSVAMICQVTTLMWMRTAMNYQYRYGTSMTESIKILYKEGGVRRFYRGYLPALAQGPLSRFGDTAANSGILALLESNESTRSLPIAVKTVAASAAAASFRIFLMPIDTLKTTLQVNGKEGIPIIRQKIAKHGIPALYYGAGATVLGSFMGHYPWFATFNYLQEAIPKQETLPLQLARNAVIGFAASAMSDTVSNSVRVIKTYRQTHTERVSYPTAVKEIVAKDGVLGLMGRGLKTRLLTNGMQGLMFAVMWKLIEDSYFKKDDKK